MKVHYWYGDETPVYVRTSCAPGGMLRKEWNPLLTDDWDRVTCKLCLKRRKASEYRIARYFKVCPKCGHGKNTRLI